MKRLIKANPATRKDHEFDFEKAVKDFKKKHKVDDEMLKNKTTQNPLYRQWSDYMLDNYPIWAMSSPAYILRGWGYICGTGLYGGGVWYPHMPTEMPQSGSGGDMSSGDMGGGE